MQLRRIVIPSVMLAVPFILTGQDSFIDTSRASAQSLIEVLRNYTATEDTTQYITSAAHDRNFVWQTLAKVTTEVSLEGEAEQYRNTLVDGVPAHAGFNAKQGLTMGVLKDWGFWSTGGFATLLHDIFLAVTGATFGDPRLTKMGERPVILYSFSVDQARSPWWIDAGIKSYHLGLLGAAWLDPNNHNAALRIEVKAVDLPDEFPLDTAEMTVDFGTIIVGGNDVFLPVFSV